MNEAKLRNIRTYLIDNVFRNERVMFAKDRYDDSLPDLPMIIASLYEELHKVVTGQPYSYFWHWANKIGSWVEDDLFSDMGGDNCV